MSDKRKVVVNLEYDHDCESPMEWDDQWKLYSFSTRHVNFKHPEELGFDPLSIGLRRKLEVGTAFILSYYEHGNSLWMLKDGRIPAGVEFQWDGVRVAGLLIWEHPTSHMGAKSYEDRMKDAQGFLDQYNEWANGQCFYYSVEDAETGEHIDSCGGFIGDDYFMETVREAVEDYEVVGVQGDADWLTDYHDLEVTEDEEATA